MGKKKINNNFYTIDGYKLDGTKYSLPDHRLYSGWGSRYPTKLTPSDLPEWYIPISNYKKHGYLNVKGITDISYRANVFDNHWLKDAFLFIRYTGKFDKDVIMTSDDFDQSVWGNDIINVLFGIERYSPEIDTKAAWKGILADYNKYADHENQWWTRDMPTYSSVKEMIEKMKLREKYDRAIIRTV